MRSVWCLLLLFLVCDPTFCQARSLAPALVEAQPQSLLELQTKTQTRGWFSKAVAALSGHGNALMGDNWLPVFVYIVVMIAVCTIIIVVYFAATNDGNVRVVGVNTPQNLTTVLFLWLGFIFSLSTCFVFIVTYLHKRFTRPAIYLSDSVLTRADALTMLAKLAKLDADHIVVTQKARNKFYKTAKFEDWISPSTDKQAPDFLRTLVRHFHPQTKYSSQDIRPKPDAPKTELKQKHKHFTEGEVMLHRDIALEAVFAFRTQNATIPLKGLVHACQARMAAETTTQNEEAAVHVMFSDASAWRGFFVALVLFLNSLVNLAPESRGTCPKLTSSTAGLLKYSKDLSKVETYPDLKYIKGWDCSGGICRLLCERGFAPADVSSVTCSISMQGIIWSHLRTDSSHPVACCAAENTAGMLSAFNFTASASGLATVLWTSPQQFVSSCGAAQILHVQTCVRKVASRGTFGEEIVAECDRACGSPSIFVSKFQIAKECPVVTQTVTSPAWKDLASMYHSYLNYAAGDEIVAPYQLNATAGATLAVRLVYIPKSKVPVVGPWKVSL